MLYKQDSNAYLAYIASPFMMIAIIVILMIIDLILHCEVK